MRIKTITYSDLQQKPCQFYWHRLLHITIVRGMNIFLIVLAILVSGSIMTVSIGYSVSVDVRGWWPIVAAAEIIRSCISATILFLLHRTAHAFSQRFLLCITGALASVHILHAVAFYRDGAEWLGVREGALALPFLEQVILSDHTFYAIDLFFIVIPIVWACWQKWHSARQNSQAPG
jgi:hypothetical protein